jgi:hypothetical protein
MDDVPDVEALSAGVDARAGGTSAIDRLAAAAATAGRLRERGDELLDRYVQQARARVCSWAEIGAALGVSKQAAQQRFVALGPERPEWPEHFTEDARLVIAAACDEAHALRHHYLGTEHFLLALAQDDGLAGTTLARLGMDAPTVRAGIDRVVGPGHAGARATLGVAPRAKRALEAARAQARQLGHRRCANPEHLLLAISAQRDGAAAKIIREHGTTDDDVRDQLAHLLAGEAPELAARLRRRRRRRLRPGRRRAAA